MRSAATRQRLAVFDMDGTLLRGRVIFALAERFGFQDALEHVLSKKQRPSRRTQHVARLLRGLTPDDLLETAEAIPLTLGVRETVQTLRGWQFVLGIISDSYAQVTEHFRNLLGMDFSVGNELLVANGRLTGEVRTPSGRRDCPWDCGLSVCKAFHLRHRAQELGVSPSATVAVGDTAADLCMLEQAALGIAFDPKDEQVQRHADVIVRRRDLRAILPYCRQMAASSRIRG